MGTAPDTPILSLPFPVSLFHNTHDFYHYDLMTLLKKSAHATEWDATKRFLIGPRMHLLRLALTGVAVMLA